MDFKLTHEPICINDTVFDGMLEHSVELDYLLPDYYPNIFKILKCKLDAEIVSQRISADKMVIDGIAYIRIVYVCEETNVIKSITQKIPFSKTLDLKYAPEASVISIKVKTDYVNCRVVNSRRLDVRGTISIRVKVIDQKEEEIISDASGLGIQVKKRVVNIASGNLCATKSFTIKEDLEVETASALQSIIHQQACAVSGECKIIANKIVAKGEVFLHILYCTGENNEMEVSEHSIPISQIIDIPGINEDYDCQVRFTVTSVDIDISSGEGENFLNVEIGMCAYVYAYAGKEIQCIDDAFSTGFESSLATKSIKTEKLVEILNRDVSGRAVLDVPKEIASVFDVWGTIKNVTHKFDNEGLLFVMDMECCIIAIDEENMPTIVEKMMSFEVRYESSWKDNDLKIDADLSLVSISKSQSEEGKLEIKVVINVEGTISRSENIHVITEISIDEEKVKTRTNLAALTIYYADKGERIWDIAKHYNTSVTAILAENDLEEPELSNRGMLLIPIIDE